MLNSQIRVSHRAVASTKIAMAGPYWRSPRIPAPGPLSICSVPLVLMRLRFAKAFPNLGDQFEVARHFARVDAARPGQIHGNNFLDLARARRHHNDARRQE